MNYSDEINSASSLATRERKYSMSNPSSSGITFEVTKEQFDLIKCEFCDDHIKRRFLEMKELFYKMFKLFMKFSKLIKNKDMPNIQKLIEDIGNAQKDFITYRNIVEKLIIIRTKIKNFEYNPKTFIIKIEGLTENEKNGFFEELNARKEILKKYRRNINELENISKKIQEILENVSFNNSLLN